MIFVVVGTQKFPFNRLLSALDKLILSGRIKEAVFAQTGNSDYHPHQYKSKHFLCQKEFNSSIEKSDLLITHGGVATIIKGLMHDKPVIAVPRLARYGEHVDDHQVQIAEMFVKQNYVMMYREGDSLENLIKEAKQHKFAKYSSQRTLAVRTIRDYLKV